MVHEEVSTAIHRMCRQFEQYVLLLGPATIKLMYMLVSSITGICLTCKIMNPTSVWVLTAVGAQVYVSLHFWWLQYYIAAGLM